MDALVSAALHEIAVEASQGCPLPKLWAGLQLPAAALEINLDARVKQMLWKQVLHVPRITIVTPEAKTLEAYHPSIQSVQEAEKLGVHVVAPEGLRESCLGLYDGKLCDAAISKDQRELLERLAKARSQGVTQSQLGKEFKTGGNKMFYVVKSLESRGLVVRHATIVRTHQPASKGPTNKFVPIVATNLVHLSRYEKEQSLGSHARYEIPSSSKSNHTHSSSPTSTSGDPGAAGEEGATEEVLINDDYPAMQRICEKLEAADDKVMVVSDLKLDLNYRFAQGHRSWRRLAKRLQDAGMVEIFNAQIAGAKIAPCIRLLKSFNTKAFNAGNDDTEGEAQLRGVKRGQVTEQVVESALDRQIYDLIDSAGPAGLYMMDIWKQLGLNNKRNYFRVTNMLSKGCIVSEAEQHKKSMLYRLRTAPNATLAANLAANRTAAVAPENADLEPQYVVPLAQFAPLSTAKIRRTRKAPEKEKGQEKEKDKQKQKEKDKEKGRAGAKDKGKVKEQEKYSAEDTTVSASNLPKDPEESNTCRALALVDLSIVKVDEDEPLVTTSGQMYPLPLQTTTAIQRELRIMQRLHEEKFIPRVELHRWIEESEKDRKDTMMDRKTLTRLLQKLQREGRVKCIVLSMPGLTNCGRSRQSEVVLLPEVQVGPELLAKVHDRIRQFDMMNRGYGSSKLKADASTVPILMTVKQIHKGKKRIFESAAEAEAEKARTLSENGFVPAKMVRVRMLHTFLWSYANGISEYADEELVMKPPDDSSCRVFSLALAVKAMPVDLFLQVVGSTKSTEELEPYINKGLRLCDLSEEISSSLMVSHANSRLSWLIDILRRLKLIRLVMGTGSLPKTSFNRGSTYSLEASLIYAMETQPFIEEPAPQPLSSLSLDAFDLTPRARHEFTMTSSESLEAYWQTLEYCFSGALPTVARKAFPGNSVPELFGLRSWTSLRVMTSEQRKGLMKRVEEGGEERRLSHAECLLLARELNLSPEQVLRVSYEKNRRLRLVQLRNEKLDNEVSRGHRIKPNIHAGANKRVVTDADLMEAAHVRAFKRQRQLEQAEAAPPPSEPTGLADIILKEGETTEPHEEEVEEDEEEDKATEENPLNISKTISKLKQTRSKRFPWSEALDKVLVRCYTRQRAILGARNHRVEWAHIPNLPAPPAACRRRTALMKSDPAIRKALNNLSSVLCARYVKRPDDAPAVSTVWRKNAETDVTEEVSQPSPRKDTQQPEDELPWDSFEYPAVAAAFEEVMQLRNIAKQISSKRTTVVSVPTLPKTRERPRKLRVVVPKVIPKPKDPAPTKEHVVEQKGDPGRARAPRIRKRKKSEKPVTLGEPISEEVVRRSLGIANAVELVKFVLLNAASAEVPSDVVDALRRCEEAHVFAAFNFLRYQDYVIHGSSGQPYVLSQKFFYNASASRFPMATALEALYTTQWLAEHDSEVDEDWVPLPSENLCGQLIQLLGIVSKGEFNIAPFLPTEGVGESEDNKNVVHGTKRKTEGGQEIQFMKPKIQRSDSSSFGFRRERGFPGVQVCIHRATKAVGELVDAAVLESQESAEDMDLDWEQARNTEAALVDVASEAMEVDVVLPSAAGDVSEAREADVACSSAADVSEVTTAREVDVAVYSATESTDAMKVDVAVPSATGFSSESVDPTNVESTEVDVAMTSAPEVDVVASSAAVQVPEPTKETAEFDSVARNVSESAEAGEGNLALVGVASNSKLVDCIDHFCSTSEDISDADEAKLDSEVLEATAHAIEAAGKDGLSIRQVLERTGHRMTEEVVWKCISALETFDVVKQVNAYDHVRVISAAHSAPFFIHVKAKNGLRGGTNADPSDRGHGESSGLSTMATLRSIATGSRSWTRNNVPSDTSSLPPPEQDEISHTVPMLPWLTGDGGVNMSLLKALTRRVLGVVMQNPGILEEHLVNQLHVLNPQTARQFLRLLESDGHVKVRKVLQATPPGPPGLLRHLIKVKSPSAKPSFGSHYYANCTSGVML